MRTLQLLILLILCNSFSFSQNEKELDSLFARVEKAKNNREFIDRSIDYIKILNTEVKQNFLVVYNDLIKALEKEKSLEWKNERTLLLVYQLHDVQEFEKAENLCEQGISWNSGKQDNWESEFHLELGMLYVSEGKNNEGISHMENAKKSMRKENPALEALILMEIGRVYYDLAEYSVAMDYYLEANTLLDKEGIRTGRYCKLMHFIGSVFKRQNNDQKAIDYYEKMLEAARAGDYKNYEGEALDLLAGVYAYMGDFDKELEYLDMALEVYRSIDDEFGEAQVLMSMAHGQIYEAEYKSALEKLQRVEEISLKYGYRHYDVTRDRYRGKIYARMGDLITAEKWYLKAENSIKEYSKKKVLDYTDLYRNMAYSYYKGGKYKKSYEYLDLHMMYKDSLLRDENQNLIHELEQKYENQKKEVEILELNKNKEIADKELSRKELMINSFIIGMALVLILLGTIFYSLIQNKKKNRIIVEQKSQVEEKNREIIDSISYAKRIQNAILPTDQLIKESLPNSFVLYKPKDIVAGDFYWMEALESFQYSVDSLQKEPITDHQSPNTILIAAADCTGHGVPGAMVSVVCNSGLNRSVREFGLTDPGKILDQTRKLVIQEFEKSEEEVKDGMDIALVSLEQEHTVRDSVAPNSCSTLKYAGAHNPLWIIRKGAEEVEEIKANKQPIGKFVNPEPYNTHEVGLNEGDTVYIFSDGYPDQFGGERGKKLKSGNLKKLLLSIQDKNMNEQKEHLDNFFENWCGEHEQIDDVCFIGIRI